MRALTAFLITSGPDGGVGNRDGGVNLPQDTEDSGGCDCGATSSAPFALMLLGLLGLLSRRVMRS